MVEEDYRFQVVIERGQARVFKNSVEAEHGIWLGAWLRARNCSWDRCGPGSLTSHH